MKAIGHVELQGTLQAEKIRQKILLTRYGSRDPATEKQSREKAANTESQNESKVRLGSFSKHRENAAQKYSKWSKLLKLFR